MIRKSITAFFILLANVVLLAHAVVPHHHHETTVCVSSSTHKHSDQSHQHNNNHQESDDCSLNQVVVIVSHQTRSDIKTFCCTINHSQFDGFQAALFDSAYSPFFSENISDYKPSLLTFDYSSFVDTRIGLRAPPIS